MTADRQSTVFGTSTGSAREPWTSSSSITTRPRYLPDLERILAERWLHPGSIVVADNVRFPGAPDYRAYLDARKGTSWDTIEDQTHVEYQSLIKDLVLESEYLGEGVPM